MAYSLPATVESTSVSVLPGWAANPAQVPESQVPPAAVTSSAYRASSAEVFWDASWNVTSPPPVGPTKVKNSSPPVWGTPQP